MKYFIYCRVSSDREDKQVLGVESQKRELIEFAAKADLEIIDVLFEDHTAHKPGRPVFNAMLKRIEKGEAQGILVWHLTRIARNSMDGGRVIYMMDEGQIQEIRTKEKTYKNITNDKFIMQIEFAMSKKSSDDTSDFVKRDNQTKLMKGEYPGNAPTGYLNLNKEGVITGKRYDQKKQGILMELGRPLGRVEKDPIIAPLMRSIIEKAKTGSYTLAALQEEAKKLGLLGFISKKKPGKQTLIQWLTNPFYYGEFDYAGKRWRGIHEPLMTHTEFEAIQDNLFKRSRPKHIKRQYALSIFVRCPECGRGLSGDYQKDTAYYRCAHAKGKDSTCTHTKHYREDTLEVQVMKKLVEMELPDAVIDWALKQLKESFKEESEQSNARQFQLAQQAQGLRTRLTRLTEKWLSPENKNGTLISDAEYGDTKRSFQKELQDLENLQKETTQNENDWVAKCEEFFLLGRKLATTYPKASYEDKRTILSIVADAYILTDGKLDIRLKEHFQTVYAANRSAHAIRTASNSIEKDEYVLLTEEKAVWQAQKDSNPH